jgi:hypothetical protein
LLFDVDGCNADECPGCQDDWMLMVATPTNVLDIKMIEVFCPLFTVNVVDHNWVLKTGEQKLREIFAPLAGQNNSAKHVTGTARGWKGMPADHQTLLSFAGVTGAKSGPCCC